MPDEARLARSSAQVLERSPAGTARAGRVAANLLARSPQGTARLARMAVQVLVGPEKPPVNPWPTGQDVVDEGFEWNRSAQTNDTITAAVPLGDTEVTTDTTTATTDPNEPTFGGNNTAWYTVDTTDADTVLIDATASDHQTQLAVYSGTADTTVSGYSLTLQATGEGTVSFEPVPATTYTVQVGSKTPGGGQQKVVKTKLKDLGVFMGWGVRIAP